MATKNCPSKKNLLETLVFFTWLDFSQTRKENLNYKKTLQQNSLKKFKLSNLRISEFLLPDESFCFETWGLMETKGRHKIFFSKVSYSMEGHFYTKILCNGKTLVEDSDFIKVSLSQH